MPGLVLVLVALQCALGIFLPGTVLHDPLNDAEDRLPFSWRESLLMPPNNFKVAIPTPSSTMNQHVVLITTQNPFVATRDLHAPFGNKTDVVLQFETQFLEEIGEGYAFVKLVDASDLSIISEVTTFTPANVVFGPVFSAEGEYLLLEAVVGGERVGTVSDLFPMDLLPHVYTAVLTEASIKMLRDGEVVKEVPLMELGPLGACSPGARSEFFFAPTRGVYARGTGAMPDGWDETLVPVEHTAAGPDVNLACMRVGCGVWRHPLVLSDAAPVGRPSCPPVAPRGLASRLPVSTSLTVDALTSAPYLTVGDFWVGASEAGAQLLRDTEFSYRLRKEKERRAAERPAEAVNLERDAKMAYATARPHVEKRSVANTLVNLLPAHLRDMVFAGAYLVLNNTHTVFTLLTVFVLLPATAALFVASCVRRARRRKVD